MQDDTGLQTRQHFGTLDACRGLCAIMVVLFHISANGYFYEWTPIRNGGRAVAFFFVLSGFVITYAYLDRLKTAGGFSDFMIRRFGRLYPLHVFTIGLLVLLEIAKLALSTIAHVQAGQAAFSGTNSLPSLAGNLFLLNGLGVFSDFTWNGPSWSISTEFYTYIVFATVAVCFRKHFVAVVGGLAILFAGLVMWADSVHLTTVRGLGAVQCLSDFMLGALTYLAFAFVKKRKALPPWTGIVALAVIAFAFCANFPYDRIIIPPLFALSIFLLAFESGLSATILNHPIPKFLGKISYSIYLMQYVVLQVFLGVARTLQSKFHLHIFSTIDGVIMVDLPLKITNDLFAVLYLAVVIATAVLTYRFIEEPGRKFFNRIAQARARKTSPEALSPQKSVP